MAKLLPKRCPKCNNFTKFYRYGKDKDDYQKYQCQLCLHQFAPNNPKTKK